LPKSLEQGALFGVPAHFLHPLGAAGPAADRATMPRMSPTDPPLHDWSAVALSQAFAAGRVSPVEVTRAVIAHVARWEPHIAALWRHEPEAALAEASERRWRAGPTGATR
jgi:hypothetical protein